mmetsp:Transcript_36077/g.85426  ORF Transcript_36077/g.85426 Transcript_36077/m.85426 type:complete len:466 (+) Transcript_36077:197-1594(+)
MAQKGYPRFSGTLRGGNTTSDSPFAPGTDLTAHPADVGAQDFGTDVFRTSRVANKSTGGARHDAVKDISIAQVQLERALRASSLAQKKDKDTGILQRQLQAETVLTSQWEFNRAYTTALNLPGAMAALAMETLFPKKDAEEEEEKFVSNTENDAAVAAAKVGYNARESAYRANLEVAAARVRAEAARKSATIARMIPKGQRKTHVMAGGDQDLMIKKPSRFMVSIDVGENFPELPTSKAPGLRACPYVHLKFINPNEARTSLPQEFLSEVVWKKHAPEWHVTHQFFVNDAWGDEERPEVLTVDIYNCGNFSQIKETEVGGEDTLIGSFSIHLARILSRVPATRFPDGREEPGRFEGEVLEKYEMFDDDGEIVMGTKDPENPAKIRLRMLFVDSATDIKKFTIGLIAMQLPPRKPCVQPSPKPPLTWTEHPDVVQKTPAHSRGGSRRSGSRAVSQAASTAASSNNN